MVVIITYGRRRSIILAFALRRIHPLVGRGISFNVWKEVRPRKSVPRTSPQVAIGWGETKIRKKKKRNLTSVAINARGG